MRFGNQNNFSNNFLQNSMLVKLIYANLVLFVAIKLLYLFFWLFVANGSPNQWALEWLAVPSDPSKLIFKPWTIITYMFLHLGLWHLFSNMLWLYFLGTLFVQFLGERKLYTVYIAGGIAGALLYVLFFNIFPVFENVNSSAIALGASASVMAIVVGIGTYSPNYAIRLLFLGDVKLKYIAIFSFVIDVLSISNSNSGGHIAHIGGAALGFLFAKQWAKGKDITAWVSSTTNFLLALVKPSKKGKMKVKYKRPSASDYEHNDRKKEEQSVVDAILDKISRSGYDSLSKKEKEILFKASGK
ncbi:rhomboid family intramembrane serine protease [Vicingaceae bacterium]|nr:rhomboid family intramembrane serine protease [Vicingaceae bacterium]MDB9963570.1 rhomboid family intramembrane serine protease [Vicingaceae bacterium]MDC1451358.1 rhomboid family intramembrane serine protease [Vicingaceae bacterium]